MAGPHKAAKVLKAMDTSNFLQKLPKRKHKLLNKFLTKLHHHHLPLSGIFHEMQFFSQIKDQKSSKLISPAGSWNSAMGDFLQSTLNTSKVHWPRAQAGKPKSILVNRDTRLGHQQAVLSSNTVIFINFRQKIQMHRRNTYYEQVLENRILIKIKPQEIKGDSNNTEYQEYTCCFFNKVP